MTALILIALGVVTIGAIPAYVIAKLIWQATHRPATI